MMAPAAAAGIEFLEIGSAHRTTELGLEGQVGNDLPLGVSVARGSLEEGAAHGLLGDEVVEQGITLFGIERLVALGHYGHRPLAISQLDDAVRGKSRAASGGSHGSVAHHAGVVDHNSHLDLVTYLVVNLGPGRVALVAVTYDDALLVHVAQSGVNLRPLAYAAAYPQIVSPGGGGAHDFPLPIVRSHARDIHGSVVDAVSVRVLAVIVKAAVVPVPETVIDPLLRVEHLDALLYAGEAERSVQRHDRFAAGIGAALGGYEDHAVGAPGSVDSHSRSVLEHLYGSDVVGIEEGQGVRRHAVKLRSRGALGIYVHLYAVNHD